MSFEGYVYKIICNTTNLTYFGSTTQKLSKRINNHKIAYYKHCNNLINSKCNYITSFEVLKNDNYDYYVLEKLQHNDKEQLKINLRLSERNYIENNKCVNTQSPINIGDDRQYYKTAHYYCNYEREQKKKSERILCECCNVLIRRDNISHHEKSLKHIMNLEIETLE
jgi:hypothetical protein